MLITRTPQQLQRQPRDSRMGRHVPRLASFTCNETVVGSIPTLSTKYADVVYTVKFLPCNEGKPVQVQAISSKSGIGSLVDRLFWEQDQGSSILSSQTTLIYEKLQDIQVVWNLTVNQGIAGSSPALAANYGIGRSIEGPVPVKDLTWVQFPSYAPCLSIPKAEEAILNIVQSECKTQDRYALIFQKQRKQFQKLHSEGARPSESTNAPLVQLVEALVLEARCSGSESQVEHHVTEAMAAKPSPKRYEKVRFLSVAPNRLLAERATSASLQKKRPQCKSGIVVQGVEGHDDQLVC